MQRCKVTFLTTYNGFLSSVVAPFPLLFVSRALSPPFNSPPSFLAIAPSSLRPETTFPLSPSSPFHSRRNIPVGYHRPSPIYDLYVALGFCNRPIVIALQLDLRCISFVLTTHRDPASVSASSEHKNDAFWTSTEPVVIA